MDTANGSISVTEASFSTIPQTQEAESKENVPGRRGKAPKRILHFSDGDLEEYSTDEEDEQDKPNPTKAIDTKKLSWPQYLLYATMAFGNGTLKVCDYVGEGLASFFGITTPKYQYEINEYERRVQEEAEEKRKEDVEMRGWKEEKHESAEIISSGPALTAETETQPQRY